MLARWESPKLGLTLPEVFIPIAEERGVIGDLSEGLMIQAFSDARQWDPALTLSVNISPVQLRDPWFAEKLLKLLVMHNFPPQRLEIEITESCMLENVAMRSEEHTSELQSLMRISYAVFCLKTQKKIHYSHTT